VEPRIGARLLGSRSRRRLRARLRPAAAPARRPPASRRRCDLLRRFVAGERTAAMARDPRARPDLRRCVALGVRAGERARSVNAEVDHQGIVIRGGDWPRGGAEDLDVPGIDPVEDAAHETLALIDIEY